MKNLSHGWKNTPIQKENESMTKKRTAPWLLAACFLAASTTTAQLAQGAFDGSNTPSESVREKQDYWKEWVDITRKQYNKALSTFGADSELTQDAKERYEKAMNEYEDARKELDELEQKR
jgi:hypothetical protein